MASSNQFLNTLREECLAHPGDLAFSNSRAGSCDRISYGELWQWSDALAAYLDRCAPAGKPVVVYGHKSPLMLATFLAAAKAGRGYAPVDIAYPPDRVNDILSQIDHPLVVSLSDDPFPGDASLAAAVLEIDAVAEAIAEGDSVPAELWVSGSDVFYLLFTSGSTGRPKGVAMSAASVDAFMGYMGKFFPRGEERVCFNRVPYTFDVSLFDIIGALPHGYKLFALEKECEESMAALFGALREQPITSWVSTPSFIESCLVDPSFDTTLLPRLDTIVLCGEALRNTTALKIIERFPQARLFNTYGPTETQAVTDIEVDRQLAESVNPLPVGYFAPYAGAVILDLESGESLPAGQVGEIYLTGDTLALGYFGRSDLTSTAFTVDEEANESSARRYKTGDKGYIDDQRRLFCLGRLDFQVKLNGFRIELGDVEQGLVSLPAVREAVVLPVEKEGKVTHLVAHVLPEDEEMPRTFASSQVIRAQLHETLPEYMIPRKIVFHDEFPLNNNGKVDRKAFT